MDRGPEEVKVVGKSGQISLGKRYAGKRLRIEVRDTGTIVLTPVVMVPESELWTLEEPHASRIGRGLAWAAETAPRETNLDELARAAASRVRPKRRARGK